MQFKVGNILSISQEHIFYQMQDNAVGHFNIYNETCIVV